MPDRGLGLDRHELDVVVDLEDRLGGVATCQTTTAAISIGLPSASLTFATGGLVITDPGRDLRRSVIGFTQRRPGARIVPGVAAEQLHDPRLAGRDRGQPPQQQRGRDEDQDGQQDHRDLARTVAQTGAKDKQGDPAQHARDAGDQDRHARPGPRLALGHRPGSSPYGRPTAGDSAVILTTSD